MRISLVVPAYNEEGNISRLETEVGRVAAMLPDYDFEFLVIDNASTDQTGPMALKLCEKDARWKYVRFSRNFGSEASIAAGMRLCTGDACVILFSDLQDPPAEIPRFVQKWREGYQIVYGVYRGDKHERLWKRILVSYYYKVICSISTPKMIPYAADYRLYDRKVLKVLNRLNERNRYMRGLSQWVGFKTIGLDYERHPRRAGRSKAPFFYMFGFAFNVIVNFSDKPLKVFTWIGLLVLTGSFALMLVLILTYFLGGSVVHGLTTTHVLLCFNIGFSALGFGIIGEYVSKVYIETKRRPLWIVQEAVGVDISEHEFG